MPGAPSPGFSVKLGGVNKLHAAFLEESLLEESLRVPQNPDFLLGLVGFNELHAAFL
jgi:hypothetical protein